MPLYEYECDSCHNEIELIQKVDDEPVEECPHCHEHSLKKKPSLNSFHLKGGGWYKDGYGSSNQSSSLH